MYYAGIDIGSTWTKAVIVDEAPAVVGKLVRQTGPEHRKLANKVMEDLLAQVGLPFEEIAYLVATGYGRVNVPFADTHVTELTCHAKGVLHFFPGVGAAIDVGGQDAKALRIRGGRLVNFVMNDKCAAGTGRFLEVLADVLEVELGELGPISLGARKPVTISSVCTIFAQQEIVNHLSAGHSIEDVIAGVHEAMAGRIVRMARSLGVDGDVVLTGGVAKNVGFVRAVEGSLGRPVLVPEDSFITGALGAALAAREKCEKLAARGQPVPRKPRRLAEARFFT
ncbi:MAG: BadF/BadG/BcrA/BcrD ATPase family protein [Deferrisomatales bacterium]